MRIEPRTNRARVQIVAQFRDTEESNILDTTPQESLLRALLHGLVPSGPNRGKEATLAFINALRTILLVTSSIFPSIALLTVEQHFYPSFLRVRFSKDRSVRNIDFSKIRDGMNLEIFLNLKISLEQRFSKIAIFVN